MHKTFIIYHPETGEILTRVSGLDADAEIVASALEAEFVENDTGEPTDDRFHYIDVQAIEIVDRPDLPDIDSVFYVGETHEVEIPPETNVYLNKRWIGVEEDGIMELSFDLDGVYKIKLIPPFPYREKEYEITVE